MLLYESLDVIKQVTHDHLNGEIADEIVRRSMPTIAFKEADGETEHWLYGNAMIEQGTDWPRIDGNQLEHTGRIKLDGLPQVSPLQPATGYLSFFDSFAWSDKPAFDDPNGGYVRYDDGLQVEERTCPPIDTELFFPQQATFVTPEGPYWTIPHYEEIAALWPDHDQQSFEDFEEALLPLEVEDHFVCHLFGRSQAYQYDTTPEPRFILGEPLAEAHNKWVHLAGIRDSSDVFDYSYAIEVQDFEQRTFNNVVFSAQCD